MERTIFTIWSPLDPLPQFDTNLAEGQLRKTASNTKLRRYLYTTTGRSELTELFISVLIKTKKHETALQF